MNNVNVDVEYCNKCGYLEKFEELVEHIRRVHPSVNINGREGRRASFEVSVNDTLVHSKLSTLAYPDYEDLSQIIRDAEKDHIELRGGNHSPKYKNKKVPNFNEVNF